MNWTLRLCEIGEGVVGAARVKKILTFLRREFAYVVVDTSSTLTEITLTILDVSDAIVLLATPDIPAIRGARLFFDLMDKLDYPPGQIVFVLNRMDKRSGITAAAVETNIKHTVAAQIANDERAVLSSINRGIPLMLGDKGQTPIQGLLDTVQAVKEVLASAGAEAEAAEGKKRLLERSRR
ncbi:MAG: hypothetical protein HY784_13620 [Chloroflexi bacterium]|nr:hypothetical protein [Chloroflexota bacterium]